MKKQVESRADRLNDQIIDLINAAIKEGATPIEVAGALGVAVLQNQIRIATAFRMHDGKKPGEGEG